MSNKEKALEFKVGAFVIAGLIVIAVMALEFGRVGEFFEKTYTITVELPDAGGLIKDAEVKLAGTKIGSVARKPQITPLVSGVRVLLKINGEIAIPRDTRFQIGSTGLLGDKYVEITASPDFNPKKFDPKDPAQILHAGDFIKGVEPQTGMDALTRQGQEVMEKLKVIMDKVNDEMEDLRVTTAKVNEGILSDANRKNLAGILQSLNLSSASFVETSKNINTVVQGAQGVVDGARQAIGTANSAMNTVNSAAGDLRITLEEGRKTMLATKTLMQKATQGTGLIPTLLNNGELSDNIRALVANLRQKGLLFYKDVPTPQQKQPETHPSH